MDMPTAREVLDFWFGPEEAVRGEWFRKDAAFDAEVRARFAPAIERALAGGLHEWDARDGADGTLARILVLDQFTRNIYRDTPRAFAGDALALAAARALVDSKGDRQLAPLRRWFAYMPFEHAEDLAMQDRAVELFTLLAAEAPATQGALDYAVRHREVIERYGRFPHRNAILGRASTADEQAYLDTPGSGF